jgi:hypothetical protein
VTSHLSGSPISGGDTARGTSEGPATEKPLQLARRRMDKNGRIAAAAVRTRARDVSEPPRSLGSGRTSRDGSTRTYCPWLTTPNPKRLVHPRHKARSNATESKRP